MDYAKISKETTGHLHAAYKSLKSSPLSPRIRALVELRTSQINGCAYCIAIHSKEARKAEVTEDELDQLVAWKDSPLFSHKERAALKWCEAITLVGEGAESGEELKELFSEREFVDLTIAISLMNCFNRLRVYTKSP